MKKFLFYVLLLALFPTGMLAQTKNTFEIKNDHFYRNGEIVPILSGEMPSPLSPPAGCAFHPRCPHARALCREQEPPLLTVNQGHAVRCHFPL